jgi:hypothetical protein
MPEDLKGRLAKVAAAGEVRRTEPSSQNCYEMYILSDAKF